MRGRLRWNTARRRAQLPVTDMSIHLVHRSGTCTCLVLCIQVSKKDVVLVSLLPDNGEPEILLPRS